MLEGIAMPPITLIGLCRLSLLVRGEVPRRQIELIHFARDELCGWRPDAMFRWLGQNVSVVYVEGKPQYWAAWIAITTATS